MKQFAYSADAPVAEVINIVGRCRARVIQPNDLAQNRHYIIHRKRPIFCVFGKVKPLDKLIAAHFTKIIPFRAKHGLDQGSRIIRRGKVSRPDTLIKLNKCIILLFGLVLFQCLFDKGHLSVINVRKPIHNICSMDQAEGFQKAACGNLALTVYLHIHCAVAVRPKLKPRPAIWDDFGAKHTLAAGNGRRKVHAG